MAVSRKAEKVSKQLADVLNIFNNAPAAPAATPKKKNGKKVKDEVDLGRDMDRLAALKLVEAAVGQMATQLHGEMRERVRGIFTDEMDESHRRPESFRGVGREASASCELRKVPSTTVLDDITAQRLKKLGIDPAEEITVPERFVINPAILEDPATMKILAQAIANEPRLKDVQVIQKQQEVKKVSAPDDVLEQLAASRISKRELSELLEKVAVVAVGKYSIPGAKDQLEAAVQIVKREELLPGLIEDDQTKVTA